MRTRFSVHTGVLEQGRPHGWRSGHLRCRDGHTPRPEPAAADARAIRARKPCARGRAAGRALLLFRCDRARDSDACQCPGKRGRLSYRGDGCQTQPGDGTVPFWSALPRAVQKQVVVNEHAQVFRGTPFKRVFYRLLGGDLGIPLELLGLEEEAGPTRLSIPTPIIHAGREFELLLVPISPTGQLVGTLSLQKLKEDGTPAAAAEEMSTVSYEGPRVSRLRLSMPPVSTGGLYELLFRDAEATSDPLRFAVVSLQE